MKKQTEGWLNAANDDLMVIREIIDNERLTHMTAFHAQQAIEKSIKAVLEEKEANAPRIHDLITLKGKIEPYLELSIDQDVFHQINDLYIDARYPSDIGLLPDGRPSMETAREFFRMASEIYCNIKDNLSEKPSPCTSGTP